MRRNRSVLSVELPETVSRSSVRDEVEAIARSRAGVIRVFARPPVRVLAVRPVFPLDPREPDPLLPRETDYVPPRVFDPVASRIPPLPTPVPVPGSVAARQLIIRFFEGLVPPRGDEQMDEVCADMIEACRTGVLNGIDPDQLLRACHVTRDR